MDKGLAACGQIRLDIREPDLYEQVARSADCEWRAVIAKQSLLIDVLSLSVFSYQGQYLRNQAPWSSG